MNIAMFLYNAFVHDARVLREARTLARAGHDVRVIATRDGLPGEEQVDLVQVLRVDREPWLAKLIRALLERSHVHAGRPVPDSDRTFAHSPTTGQRPIFSSNVGGTPLALIRRAYASLRWLKYSRGALRAAAREHADVYIAHDLDTLPIAAMARARRGGRIVYDSHELFTDSASADPFGLSKRRLSAIERHLIRRVDGVITVSEAMALELSRRHGVPLPSVVRNFPDLRGPSARPPPRNLREELDVPESSPLVLYVGRLHPERGLEQLILAAAKCPEIVVALMGDGPLEYVSSLHAFASAARLTSRVHLVPPVPPDQVVLKARAADVGVTAYRDAGLSARSTLPNKLFEYLAAGVPVVASRFPVLAQVVEGHNVGVICDPDDPDALAGAIRWVVSDPERHRELKRNALIASRMFSWAIEEPRFLGIIERSAARQHG